MLEGCFASSTGLKKMRKSQVNVEGSLLIGREVDVTSAPNFVNNHEQDDEGRRREVVAKEVVAKEASDDLTPRVPVIVVRQRGVDEDEVLVNMEMALSRDERGSVIRRSPKEGMRKRARILLPPTGKLLTLEDQQELKPSHHSTPLLPTDQGELWNFDSF